MKKLSVYIAIAVATLAGCANSRLEVWQDVEIRSPIARTAKFDPAEYVATQGVGSSTVEVNVREHMWGSNARNYQIDAVYLNPKTTYSKEWFDRNYIVSTALQPADVRQAQYVRMGKKTGSKDGVHTYVISGVPAGEYYVVAATKWMTDNGDYANGERRQKIAELLLVDGGAVVNLSITDRNKQFGLDWVNAWAVDNEWGQMGADPMGARKVAK